MADFRDELIATANAVCVAGKGILAADESTGTIGNRFAPIEVENNEENRRAYREMLFTTPDLEQYISGVILYDETLRQSTADGVAFPDLLRSKNIVVGIKADQGMKPLRGTDGENYTQGLDNLGARCDEWYALGARFAKWRAALTILPGSNSPSDIAIKENCNGLARYAAICQDHGLVPIVEPEVLMDGEHDLSVGVAVTQKVLAYQYYALQQANVLLEGTILKVNMVCPGAGCPKRATPEEVGRATLTVLQRTMPAAVPGVNFLSGGLSERDATLYLNAMNRSAAVLGLRKPWNLSFSYGRALQHSCLRAWMGKAENVPAAQAALMARAKANGEASKGEFVDEDAGGAASADADASLFQANYTY